MARGMSSGLAADRRRRVGLKRLVADGNLGGEGEGPPHLRGLPRDSS